MTENFLGKKPRKLTQIRCFDKRKGDVEWWIERSLARC
jgi:hypothetical protein